MTTDKHKAALITLLETDLPITGSITLDLDSTKLPWDAEEDAKAIADLYEENRSLKRKNKEILKTFARRDSQCHELTTERVELKRDITDLHTHIDELDSQLDALRTERDEFKELYELAIKETPAVTRAKLSQEQVWDIRDLIKQGVSDSVIAKQLNIKASAIWRIRNGKAYRKVPARPHPSTQPHKPTKVRAGHGVIEQS